MNQQVEEVQCTSSTKSYWLAAQQQLPTAVEIRTRQRNRDAGAFWTETAGTDCAKNFGCSESLPELIQALDHASDSLRGCELGHYEELGFSGKAPESIVTLHHLEASPQFPLLYVGSGHHGSVYRLRSPTGKAYALKVFYRRDVERDFSGPYSEAALGAFITKQQVSDMPWLCLAHPEKGWILSEYVDDTYRNQNPGGPSWSSLDLINLDHQRDDCNHIENSKGYQFRVDYGHLMHTGQLEAPGAVRSFLQSKVTAKERMSTEDFLKLYEDHPTDRHDIADALFLVEPVDRLKVLEHLYDYPEMQHYPIQDYIRGKLFQPEDTVTLFDLMLKHPNPLVRAQAIFDIRDVSPEDRFYLCQQWKQHEVFSAFNRYCE